jgi:ribosomal protein L37AE/L43A
MTTDILTLVDEFKDPANKIYLSTYGAIYALGFTGKQDFINRSHNMAYNHSITNNTILKEVQAGLWVCRTSKERLANGLKNYFINEIKYTREIPPLKDEYVEIPNGTEEPDLEYIIEYDDAAIEKLAETKTSDFIEKYIIPKTFMIAEDSTINNHFYEVSFEKAGNEEESGLDLVTNLNSRE